MKKSVIISLAALTLGSFCTVAIAAPETKTEPDNKAAKAASPSADWKPLYRGTLDDFRIYFRGQGYIDDVQKQEVFVAEPEQIHVRKGTNGLITTKVPYSHYHVKVDYRWGAEGGSMNAGLMSHVDLNSECVKDNRPRSVEINMKADAPGSIWLASKLGPFASSFVDKNGRTYLPQDQGGQAHDASPYSKRTILARYPVEKKPNSKPHGEWNTLEAIVHGADSVEIIHNGHTVNLITNLRDLKQGSKEPGKPLVEGGIGLQSEGQEIFYRNFVIKELKPNDRPDSSAIKPDASGGSKTSGFDPLDWKRPVDNPVFTSAFGNNHDSVLFVDPELEYPYHMIISHTAEAAHLWRAKKFSWSSKDWELVSDQYKIGKHYEYDDGVKVDGTYYLYEDGIVYTFSGPLEEASGKWKAAGKFPHKQCDDIGIYYEDGVFHVFGEHGNFPHGPDGTSLAHYSSTTGLGDWKLVNAKAVDPNPDGGHKYGVGDATIAKIEGHYYIFCDRESKGSPYKVVAWRSKDINKPFEYVGKAITPRSDEVDDWDNHRIQDPDIAYIPELGRYIITANMRDTDGNPGGNFPTLKGNGTRVIGVFYHGSNLPEPQPKP